MAGQLTIDSGDTAWMLVATALVMLMLLPGLALFYGGLVRAKNLLSVMSQVSGITAVSILAWVLWDYSLAFNGGNGLIGDFGKAGFAGLAPSSAWAVGSGGKAIPELVFAAFQMSFAAITGALVIGALVERVRFGAIMLFSLLWQALVYAPLAHMVWASDGFLLKFGAIDFAGGTVVHINAAAAALVCAVLVGARKDYARQAILPQNVPFTLLGAGLLWLGWFGFNGGSALAASRTAALAFANTMLAPTATLVVWTLLDLVRTKKATAIGAATGIVVGLVAITPAAGFISPLNAILLGAIAAFPSYYALLYRASTRLDDSLDVVAAHGVGGIVGALLTGVLAQKSWNDAGGDGVIAGNWRQFGVQVIAVVATIVYSAVGTFLIVKLIALVTSLRVDPREEGLGLDFSQHGEEAYSRGEGAILVLDRRSDS